MTLQSFATLGFQERLDIVSAYGTYLGAHRSDPPFFITLYAVFDFYVEAWYLPQKGDVVQLSAFDDYDSLDPFLVSVDITGAFPGLVNQQRR